MSTPPILARGGLLTNDLIVAAIGDIRGLNLNVTETEREVLGDGCG